MESANNHIKSTKHEVIEEKPESWFLEKGWKVIR
jgi:hypothetical protein